MVSMFDAPDPDILAKSLGVLWVTKFKTGENLRVCSTKDIHAAVALLPYKQKPGYHFIFEDFGENLAHEEPIDAVVQN